MYKKCLEDQYISYQRQMPSFYWQYYLYGLTLTLNPD